MSYPLIEPSNHLVAANGSVNEAEQAQVGDRFKSGGGVAELAFAAEIWRLDPNMDSRLVGLQHGQPKVFGDTAITNFTEFFNRFRRLNVHGNPELDALVYQARQIVTGIEP